MPNPSPGAPFAAAALALSATPTYAADGGFAQALVAPGPSPSLGEAAHAFDWLIGDWDMEITDDLGDGKLVTTHGVWRFAWVLDGRAVQDVLIAPVGPAPAGAPRRFGSSIRVYDEKLKTWRITWINPASGIRNELWGGRVGPEVVLLGLDGDGRPMRWSFSDITPDSSLWRGEKLEPDGRTWRLQSSFKLRRIKAGGQ